MTTNIEFFLDQGQDKKKTAFLFIVKVLHSLCLGNNEEYEQHEIHDKIAISLPMNNK